MGWTKVCQNRAVGDLGAKRVAPELVCLPDNLGHLRVEWRKRGA